MGSRHPFDLFDLDFWENSGVDVPRLYSEMGLMDKRILLLFGELNETTANTLSSFIRVLNLEDRTSPIKLFINSWGGNAKVPLSVYATMARSQAPFETCCVGRADSLPSLILAAGRPVFRVGFPNSFVTLNPPHMSEADREKIVRIYAQLTGKPESVISKDMESGFLMTAEEAKEYGILDRIVLAPE